jgi:hypothetical protein
VRGSAGLEQSIIGGTVMAGCQDMKVGQVYICPSCGIELQVKKECTECCGSVALCCDDPCQFACCGIPLVLKKK